MKELNKKTALVTGGSRGIGKAIISKFVNEGCNVAFTYHSSKEKAIALENIDRENVGTYLSLSTITKCLNLSFFS